MAQTEKYQLYIAVYQVVQEIPEGKVATYGQVAKLLGLPNHARHVGFALSALDSDSSIPWYRVVNAKGEVHPRHAGEPSFQRQSLEKEGVVFSENGRISLKKFQWCPKA